MHSLYIWYIWFIYNYSSRNDYEISLIEEYFVQSGVHFEIIIKDNESSDINDSTPFVVN